VLETKIWEYLVLIEIKFGEEKALEILEKVYNEYKSNKKNSNMYLDVWAYHKMRMS
ncbi:MAG: hypothetical protein GXO21_00845, partial [Aquificae bacterium]|nr:hypothetical protein [Aquificota bacterium]